METILKYAKDQYELVRESRKVLFDYCKTISPADFLNENSSFGRGGSIRNLLVHIANTYEFWIDKHGLNKSIVFTTYSSKQNINDIIELFTVIDSIMYEFIELFKEPEIKEISYEINGTKSSTSPFKLFTHVITHEFHHKGQIFSISRHLGYTPVDTDVMR
jgi:uncharacterized damage-inducible protein DinB